MEKETVKFSPVQVVNKTPEWAKWIFRISYVLITVAVFIIGGDDAISAPTRIRVLLYLNGVSMAIYFISKMFGINVKEDTKKYEES